MDCRAELRTKIERLVSGAISVPEFQEEYYDFYLEQVPEGTLNERDRDFFGEVQERLDWTAEDPPAEDRREGWMDFAAYRKWVANELARYLPRRLG